MRETTSLPDSFPKEYTQWKLMLSFDGPSFPDYTRDQLGSDHPSLSSVAVACMLACIWRGLRSGFCPPPRRIVSTLTLITRNIKKGTLLGIGPLILSKGILIIELIGILIME